MLKKLRRRFILINMTLVSLVLAIVFIFVYQSTAEQMARDSNQALERAMAVPNDDEGPGGEGPPPANDKGKPKYPIMLLVIDSEGRIASEMSNLDYSQEDYADLVAAVEQNLPGGSLNTETKVFQGVLAEENLRYRVSQGVDGGYRLAFADRSAELSTLNSLLLNSLIIASISLGIFFLISLFLARWVLKPVAKAWDQQSEFIANASHELKTPLTVLLADLAILRRHSHNTIEQEEKWIASMETAGGEMSELINELLYLARLEAEVDALEKTGVRTSRPISNFSRLVTESVLNFEPLVFDSDKSIEADIDADLYSDYAPDEWGKVLAILLDNALKYSAPRTSIGVRFKKQNEKYALLTIVSRGELIPEERLPYLFDRFYRSQDRPENDKGGFGLGLAIAQEIATKSATRITASSSAENGNQFEVQFRLKQA